MAGIIDKSGAAVVLEGLLLLLAVPVAVDVDVEGVLVVGGVCAERAIGTAEEGEKEETVERSCSFLPVWLWSLLCSCVCEHVPVHVSFSSPRPCS
jgi:hypothetical protein